MSAAMPAPIATVRTPMTPPMSAPVTIMVTVVMPRIADGVPQIEIVIMVRVMPVGIPVVVSHGIEASIASGQAEEDGDEAETEDGFSHGCHSKWIRQLD